MKKILSVLMIALIASTAVMARKADRPKTADATVTRNGSTYKLLYKGYERADVKISIINDKNELIYSETLHKVNGFARPYNFSQLPEGDYTIEITDGKSNVVERISYKKENALKLSKLAKVAGTTDKYLLTVSNKGNAALTIKVYDENNDLQYAETQKVSGDFAKVYQLSKFKGKVWFEVTDTKGNISKLSN